MHIFIGYLKCIRGRRHKNLEVYYASLCKHCRNDERVLRDVLIAPCKSSYELKTKSLPFFYSIELIQTVLSHNEGTFYSRNFNQLEILRRVLCRMCLIP